MRTDDDARALASSVVAVATGAGCRTTALLTDMDQVLGRTGGNAVEVREAIAYLAGGWNAEPRQHEVTMALSSELLVTGGLYPSPADARAACERALASGAAAERFARMVAALGGPSDLLERPDEHLPRPAIEVAVQPSRPGVVAAIDVRQVGLAIVGLGGGRTRPDQQVDHAVGVVEVAGLGEWVGPDRPVCRVLARTEANAQEAAAAIGGAYSIADAALAPRPVIRERVAG